MAFEKIPVVPGDIITSVWGNHIQTQYDEAKAELDAHLADNAPNLRGNQIYHVEVVSSSGSETPEQGRIIFDMSQGKFFGGNGSGWV